MCITNTRSQTRMTGNNDDITIRAPKHYKKIKYSRDSFKKIKHQGFS